MLSVDSLLAGARSDRDIIESNVDQAVEVLVCQREGELGWGLEFGEGNIALGPVREVRPEDSPVYLT